MVLVVNWWEPLKVKTWLPNWVGVKNQATEDHQKKRSSKVDFEILIPLPIFYQFRKKILEETEDQVAKLADDK